MSRIVVSFSRLKIVVPFGFFLLGCICAATRFDLKIQLPVLIILFFPRVDCDASGKR